MNDSFKCAFLQFDITPNVTSANPAFLQGMGGAPRKASAIAIPLSMELCMLEDRNFTKLLFVSGDIFGFDPSVVKQVREHALQWGIEPEGIVLNASHTHYAPGTLSTLHKGLGPYYDNYAKQISHIIVSNLQNLYEQLESCRLFAGTTDVRIGVNRRLPKGEQVLLAPNPGGTYITDTPFLKIELMKSGRNILWVSHGCHPTGMGEDTRISSDYPGFMKHTLKRNGVADGIMFFQGAGGSTKAAEETETELKFSSNISGVRKNGLKLATAISEGLKKELLPISGDLFASMLPVDLPLKTDANSGGSQKGIDTMQIEIQMLGLGDQLNLLSLPGEPVAELAEMIKKIDGFKDGDYLLGYTNGLNGYLTTDAIIEAGGYEAEKSAAVYQQSGALTFGSDKKIIDAIGRLMKRRANKNEVKSYGRYHHQPISRKAFFVLSSGRCGTMTLSRLLETATNARVWHHPEPFLIKETLDAYLGLNDKSDVFWKARSPFVYKSWAEGVIHGETDHNMTPFVDSIAADIPDSQFIVLIRNPWDFVRSGMRRNYYKSHPWDVGRLRPSQGSADAENWDAMDAFEKICWLWSATYAYIQEKTRNLDKGRVRIVRFEDLVKDANEIEQIFDFLNLDGFDSFAINNLLIRKFNKQVVGNFPKKEHWSEERHQTLWKHCGPIAESFGYVPEEYTKEKEQKIYVYDYLNYDHQRYPASPDPAIVTESNRATIKLDKNTKIVSLGSCFAGNIALELLNNKFNYIITELPFAEFSAHWGQVFNTASMRQIFEYSFDPSWSPVCRWWPREGNIQDPYRRNIIYGEETCEKEFEEHRSASALALKNAEIVILTLGLIETWRDKRDGMTYYRVPYPSIFDEDIHEFHVQTVDECVSDLKKVYTILKKNNESAKLVVSVSPVPLYATFRKDTDVISANTYSKSSLRVAAEYFCSQFEDASYFPSYEIVTQILEDPWEEDGRHVTKQAVGQVMDTFRKMYS